MTAGDETPESAVEHLHHSCAEKLGRYTFERDQCCIFGSQHTFQAIGFPNLFGGVLGAFLWDCSHVTRALGLGFELTEKKRVK